MLFGWMMVYANRMILSSCLPLIMDEFGLTYTVGGFLFTSYFYLYMAMQFPAGLLGDKFGRKRVLTIGTFLWSIVAFITSTSRTFLELFIYRALLGLTHGTYFGNDRSIVAHSTPKEKRGLGQAVSLTGMGIGLSIGVIVGGYLAQLVGWRMAMAILAVPGFLVAILILKVIREVRGGSQMKVGYSKVVSDWRLWVLYVTHFLILYPYWVLGSWTPKVFLEIGVKELGTASAYSSFLGFSAIPGLLLLGPLSDVFENRGWGRRLLISFLFIPLALSLVLLGYMIERSFVLAVLVLVFISGMCIWGLFAGLYSYVADTVSAEIYGSTFGLLNAIGFISSLIAPPVTGFVRDVTGSFAWGFYVGGILAFLGCFTILIKRKFSS